MGLTLNPDIIRICRDDPQGQYLIDKIAAGANVAVCRKNHPEYGAQIIISAPGDVMGASGGVLTMSSNNTIPNNVNMVLLDSAANSVTATLPHPAEMVGWLSIVAIDTTNGVSITPAPDTILFDNTNCEFNFMGDSMILVSNRVDTWYIVGRHFANWYY